ncbi:hypothetical protein QYF36_021860 [Acer negundo]|nr:hypothetical protein QYF36_021860 [Acer negundo]
MALVSLLDFSKVVNDAHPSLGDPTIGLVSILKMRWNQVETSIEERQKLVGVTCLISSSVDEVTGQGSLALDVIEQVELEVKRLNIKANKMDGVGIQEPGM